MKTGRFGEGKGSLVRMAAELERQLETKRDYIADTRRMILTPDAKSLALDGVALPMAVNEVAHKQLAAKLDVPTAFYGRLQQKHPDILAGMLNQLFQREPQKVMARTLDSRVRAIVTEKYRPLDNYDFADAIFPVLQEAGADIVSCELTEQRMYIKVLCPWLDRELPMPEGYVMGQGHNIFVRRIIGAAVFSNSEVGMGGINVNPGIFEKQCTNLATFRDEGYSKIHVGKRKGQDDEVFEYLSDDTRRLDDAAVWARVRDMVRAVMDGRVTDRIVAKMVEARGDVIDADPVKVVEVFAKRKGLNEDERGGLLRHLTNSGEMTRYGLQWAVTRLASDVESYDRASELERIGGEVIELPRSDWQTILKAAA
jgi:hypothetical protein